jgi:outer membrane lipoprotein carrier protein
MRMLKYLCLILIFSPMLANADDAANQLAQLLGNLKSVQANFVQSVNDGKGRVLQKSSGVMSLQRPGKFRWDVRSPSKQLLVADGQQVWFYDVGLAQVSVQKQTNNNQGSPAMLLSGSTQQLTQDFYINKIANAAGSDQAFKLVPQQKNGLFQAVRLYFQNKQLRMMQLADNLGQSTVIQFSGVKMNPALSANLFRFTAPRGVDVVRQ